MKKILVLGATGAMATYLIPEMLNKGFKVTGISLDQAIVSNDNYTHKPKNLPPCPNAGGSSAPALPAGNA